MAAKLDYHWHLRKVMADRGMFITTDLIAPLAERGISLSSSQVYRLVVERPERLSLKILMALLDILDCTMDDLIEPISVGGAAKKPKKAAASSGTAPDSEGLGGLRQSGPGSGVLTGRDYH
jgi:DNA-binding Xre family transcriptional regulator